MHPNVGLALALRERGHEVLLVAPSLFRPLAERTGLEFAGILSEEESAAAIHDPDLWHPWKGFSVVAKRLVLPSMRPTYELITRRMEAGRTVVAASGLAFGARLAHEKLGVPLATVYLQPTMFRSLINPVCYGFPDIIGTLPPVLRGPYMRSADRFIIDPPLLDGLNRFRGELGLAAVKRVFKDWVHSPQLVLGLFPDWFSPPQPDWPPNVVLPGFPLWDEGDLRTPPAEVDQFLSAGEPPVVFTAGTAMVQAARFFQVSAEVCRTSGRRGLLLTQFPEQLPRELPEGVRHFDYVPFSAVLPRAAALVHHGGIGTAAQAIAAGTPQLVVPSAHDQPDNAVRIRRLGLGDYVLPKAYKAAKVATLLERLTAPDIRENCRKRAAEVAAAKPLEVACGAIEKLRG